MAQKVVLLTDPGIDGAFASTLAPFDPNIDLLGLASAFDRDPELPLLMQPPICLGGAWHEPGNASHVAEFHFYCDPLSERQVLRCGAPTLLVPLDVTRKLVFSPSDLLQLPNP